MTALVRLLLRGGRRRTLVAALLSALSGVCGAGFVAVVNEGLDAGSGAATRTAVRFAVVCAVLVVTRYAAQAVLYAVGQDAVATLREGLARDIVGAPLRRVEQVGPSRLMTALADDLAHVSGGIPGLPQVLSSVVMVLATMVYLTVVSAVIAWWSLGAVAVGVVLHELLARRGTALMTRARELQDELNRRFSDVTGGLKEVKLSAARRADVTGALGEASREHRDRSVAGLLGFELAGNVGQAVFLALVGVVVFVLPDRGVDAAAVAGSVLILLFTVSSLQGALGWLPIVGRAGVAVDAVARLRAELADGSPERLLTPPDLGPPARPALISYRGLTHTYPGARDEEFTLGPVDLDLRPSEVTFVVGGNGSGKTTLAKLIVGVYHPATGSIHVDGVAVQPDGVDAFRQRFGAVFTDYHLFDRVDVGTGGRADTATVRADTAAVRAEATAYLARLDLDHKVSLTDGMCWSSTELSTGQRKRLALIAALLERRPVLVFDEWAADQDPAFKEVFYRQIVPALRDAGRCVVVVTHDERFFDGADRLLRLDEGRLLEEVRP